MRREKITLPKAIQGQVRGRRDDHICRAFNCQRVGSESDGHVGGVAVCSFTGLIIRYWSHSLIRRLVSPLITVIILFDMQMLVNFHGAGIRILNDPVVVDL